MDGRNYSRIIAREAMAEKDFGEVWIPGRGLIDFGRVIVMHFRLL